MRHQWDFHGVAEPNTRARTTAFRDVRPEHSEIVEFRLGAPDFNCQIIDLAPPARADFRMPSLPDLQGGSACRSLGRVEALNFPWSGHALLRVVGQPFMRPIVWLRLDITQCAGLRQGAKVSAVSREFFHVPPFRDERQ
ncbi:MAG: hypothetical protein QNJ44_17875 [Rhodobacter sp.]|nr:hypothetical protein [Rhodobacter sp.]